MSFWRHSIRLTNRVLTHATAQINITDSRNIKRWVAPTIKEIAKRRNKVGPDQPKPRSSYLEWNYDMELHCFGKRLGENFDEKLLKEALIQREWANLQEIEAKEKGNESYVPEQHNHELAQDGFEIISSYIKEVYSKSYPSDIVNSIHDYLTTDEMLAHVAKHLGVIDLVKATEYPLETKTLADAFKAIVAALSFSNDLSRAQLFVKDFVISQMNGKDVYDIWNPEKPFDYLVNLLKDRGVKEIEPRLCNESAANTILANYQIGLYDTSDKKLLGIGWGESIQIAKDTAALDAIQRIYGNSNNLLQYKIS